MQIDQAKLEQFLGQVVGELGAAMNAALVLIGEKLGLYKAMAGAGPMTPAELAKKTSTDERYVREWLSAQAAGGYVTYDPAKQKFELPDEQAFALADGRQSSVSSGSFPHRQLDAQGRAEAGGGVPHRRRRGMGRARCIAFRGDGKVLPAQLRRQSGQLLDPVAGRRRREAQARGASGRRRMRPWRFHHPDGEGVSEFAVRRIRLSRPSVGWARRAAAKAGAKNATFEVAAAKDFHGAKYDLVAFFDCLHDMGDPVGAASHVREMLNPEGAWMIVEPFANDKLEDNLNPAGRLFYAASTMICTPASRAQEVGLCLGAQAGEARMRKVVMDGGFTQFRRATETPFNLVYEAKP